MITIIGNTTLDLIIDKNDLLHLKVCGGNALYSAVSAMFWEKRVSVVSRVGFDYPKDYLLFFENKGIDISAIHTQSELHRLVSAYRYDNNGNRYFFDLEEEVKARNIIDPEAIENKLRFQTERKNLVDINLFDPIPQDVPERLWDSSGFHVASMRTCAQQSFIKQLNKRNKIFSLDPGSSGINGILGSNLVSSVPILLPSEEDLRKLFFKEPFEHGTIAKKFGDLGAQILVIKCGKAGSKVYDFYKNILINVPAYPSRVVDATGAGDSYCAGFLAGYINTKDLIEAALWGTISASIIVEGVDARFGLNFSEKEINYRLSIIRKSEINISKF